MGGLFLPCSTVRERSAASVTQLLLQYAFEFFSLGIDGKDSAVGIYQIAATAGIRYSVLLPHLVFVILFQQV